VAHRLDTGVENVARKMKDGWAAEMMATSNGCVVCGRVHEASEGDDHADELPSTRP
jgi:hypothetical protein